jgi:hypothetical protein
MHIPIHTITHSIPLRQYAFPDKGRLPVQAGFFVWGNLFPFWKNVKSVNLVKNGNHKTSFFDAKLSGSRKKRRNSGVDKTRFVNS